MTKGRFTRIGQIEQRIEQLVEGNFARLFAGRLQPREVATRLTRALEDNILIADDGTAFSPTLFTISLNPEDRTAMLEASPDLGLTLVDTVVDLANRAGLRLLTHPQVILRSDPALPVRSVLVEAHHAAPTGSSTQVFTETPIRKVPPVQSTPQLPRNPQLIVRGNQYIPLNRPVINIGRRHDNHIILDDVRVSRTHAQLRLRFGRYVLYDLGSTGGTMVNDHRITECILRPGDVISLGGAMLIYVEDESSTNNTPSISDTQMRPPLSDNAPKDVEKPDPMDNDPTL